MQKIFFSGHSGFRQKNSVRIFLRRNSLGGASCHLDREKQPLLLRNVSESYSYSGYFKALKIISQEFLLNSIDPAKSQISLWYKLWSILR